MKRAGGIVVGLVLGCMAACGSDGDVVEEERGDTSIKVTIVGNGEVEHNLGASPNNPCTDGTCIWDFTPGSTVSLTATPGPGCVFEGWGLDCEASGTNPTCPTTGGVTVDGQYDVRATFNCL